MVHDYPTVIVDNFFKYPLDVREFALSLDYKPSEEGIYSGKRTTSLHITHINFFRNVCEKILNTCGIPFKDYSATMHFHLTSSNFGNSGWVHIDDDGSGGSVFASIIYLNLDNNTIDTGTSFYRLSNLNHIDDQVPLMRESFIKDTDNEQAKIKHNKDYSLTTRIGSQFNRMIVYDSKNLHAGSGYFGDTDNTSRLTLLTFFRRLQAEDDNTPLRRAERYSIL